MLPFLSITLYAQVDTSTVPEANPARPTVSTPATLTAAGYLQFENGGLYAATSPEFSKRLGIEQVTKLSVARRAQFLAVFEPFTHSTGAAVSGNRPGEVFAGATVDPRLCGWQPMVGVIPTTEKHRNRRRLRLWFHPHLHGLGALCRLYLSPAASTLASRERHLLMGSLQGYATARQSRGAAAHSKKIKSSYKLISAASPKMRSKPA
jgi:hypothetical protein